MTTGPLVSRVSLAQVSMAKRASPKRSSTPTREDKASLSPRLLSSRSSPSRSPAASISEDSPGPSPGPTDVGRSSICYQRHRNSPAANFLSPISLLFSKSAEHISDSSMATSPISQQSSSNSLAPTPTNSKMISFSGSLTPTSSPQHGQCQSPSHLQLQPQSQSQSQSQEHEQSQMKRAASGKRGGGGGGGGGTLLKRVSGSIRRSQSANTHKEIPKAALKLREKSSCLCLFNQAEALRAASAQLDRGARIEEERTDAPTFDDEAANTGDESAAAANDKNKKKTTIAGVFQNLISLRKPTLDAVETRLDKLLRQPKPPLETLLLWGRSLDALLNDKYGLQLFRGFLRTEFSDENIEFWIECENYKSIPERKLSARAQKIYDDFIAVQAPREVNLDSKTRLHTMAAMTSPTQHTFEQAQRRIESLMEKDSYQRFLRSELYCGLVRQAKEDKQTSQ